MKKTYTILFLISQFVAAYAIQLKGLISDNDSKAPIDYALIRIQIDGIETGRTLTLKDGTFSIELDRNQNYKIYIDKKGYDQVRLDISTKFSPSITEIPALNASLFKSAVKSPIDGTKVPVESSTSGSMLTSITSTSTTAAPISVVLKGKVYHQQLGGLAGEELVLKNSNTGETQVATCSDNGNYSFVISPNKNYSLSVRGNLPNPVFAYEIYSLSTLGVQNSVQIIRNFENKAVLAAADLSSSVDQQSKVERTLNKKVKKPIVARNVVVKITDVDGMRDTAIMPNTLIDEQKIAARRAEELRKAEEIRLAIVKVEELKKAEEIRLAAVKAEEANKAEELRLATIKMEELKKAEEQRLAAVKLEETKKAEEFRLATLKAQELKKADELAQAATNAEELRKAEERKLAAKSIEDAKKAEELKQAAALQKEALKIKADQSKIDDKIAKLNLERQTALEQKSADDNKKLLLQKQKEDELFATQQNVLRAKQAEDERIAIANRLAKERELSLSKDQETKNLERIAYNKYLDSIVRSSGPRFMHREKTTEDLKREVSTGIAADETNMTTTEVTKVIDAGQPQLPISVDENRTPVIDNKIYFGPGKAILDESAKKYLTELATKLKFNTNLKLDISIHTDADDEATVADYLCKLRTKNITDLFVHKLNVNFYQLNIRSVGSTQGANSCKKGDPNCSALDHQMNRRIELTLSN